MTKKEWINLNPLKRWMKENSCTITDVARHFEVSYFTAWQYLQGLIPDTRNKEWFFGKLVDLTGNEEIEEEWYTWGKMQYER